MHRILELYVELAVHLRDVLNEERSALEAPDVDQLRAVTNTKQHCVRQLEELELKRLSLCQEQGFATNETGMQELLDWCHSDANTNAAWATLLHSARQSDEMNRVNGAIGRVMQEQAASTLATVSGVEQKPSIYEPEGMASTQYEQRALARA